MSAIQEIKWKSEFEFVTIGPFHLKYWLVQNSNIMNRSLPFPAELC